MNEDVYRAEDLPALVAVCGCRAATDLFECRDAATIGGGRSRDILANWHGLRIGGCHHQR